MRCVASPRSPVNLPWLAASAGFFYIDAGAPVHQAASGTRLPCLLTRRVRTAGIRGYMKFMRKSAVREAAVLPGGVAKLVVSTGDSMAYEPGQYIWIAFPGLPGPEALPSLSFHPYSISSAYAPGDATYTLHVKSMGADTWSEAVLAAAAQGADGFKGGCRVGGPCGRFSISPSHFERVVLVAGGIGFTPLVSLLADIVRDAAGGKAGKEGADGAAAARRYASVTHVTVLWAVQSAPCLSWFAAELEAARAAAAPLAVDLQLFVTRAGKEAAAAEGPFPFTAGRPDVAAALARAAAQPGAGPTGVFACGPAQMLDDTRDAVAAANSAAASDAAKCFLLHTETFLF